MTDLTNLFNSTAEYYARYRPGYAPEVFARIREAFGLDGAGRLLDLGCGTGEIARRLHADFDEVVGLDINTEMIAEAERQSAEAGIINCRWIEMPAETISPDLGRFRLATFGCAFHWMNQAVVLARVYDLIESGGVVIMGNPGGIMSGGDAWEKVAQDVLKRWLGRQLENHARIKPNGDGAEKVSLAQSQFVDIELDYYHWQRLVDVETIIGELFSMSASNRAVLGDNADAFAADMRQSLLQLEQSGQFVERITTEYIFGFKR